MNTIKSVLLLGVLTGLLMFIGGLFGGKGGVMIAFLFAVVMNFGAYWFSDKIVLKMYKAQEVTEQQAPEIYALVKSLVTQGVHAHAEGLHHPGRHAECLCHGPR